MRAAVTLPRLEVPDESVYQASFGAHFHTGAPAREYAAQMPAGVHVALDIETPSVTDSFTVKCVTACWVQEGATHVVLLDPSRSKADWAAVRTIAERAHWLVLHNSPFDVPSLVVHEMMRREDIDKVMDTLVLARSAWPDTLTRKGLEALVERVLGVRELSGALKLAQKASGLTSNEKWYREGDIHMPSYRMGAMADTVMTLRLAAPLYEAAVARQLDHPFGVYGCTDRETAGALVLREQRNNRIMLRRASKGIRVDYDYLDSYVEEVEEARDEATLMVKHHGLRPGVGADIVKRLDADGVIPANWPRTPKTNALKSDKASMERLPDHPLAKAHLLIAHTKKVLGYMDKVAAKSQITGRLHPQFHILGASATGRMSASEPELQQFPEEARPILLADNDQIGLTSIDWSSIEPALLAWMAKDWDFITPFEQGADLYEPIMKMAGIVRKPAKVVLLGDMYGQGKGMLAASLGTTEERAQEIKAKMRAAMPLAARFMNLIKNVGAEHGLALTVSGRVLTIPRFNGVPAAYKAVNYTIQGSNADLIYEAMVAADEAGVADEIMLPMHDEIVCNSNAADEIQAIMSIAPPELIRRAGGRVPVIRTDRQFLGRSWKAC